MSDDSLSACLLGLNPDELAQFRSGELPEDRAQSIANHLASCPICGAYVTEGDRADSELSGIPVLPELAPATDPSRQEAAADRHTEQTLWRSGRKRVRVAATSLGAIAGIVLVALGFAQLFASRGSRIASTSRTPTTLAASPTRLPRATTLPTPTAVPVLAFDRGLRVAWKELSFPDAWCQLPSAGTPACGAGNTWAPAMLSYTAADPDMVYACVPSGSHTTMIWTIWRSRDRGATWSRMGTLPTSQPAGCRLIVDSIDPAAAIAQLQWSAPGASPLQSNVLAFVTTDSGHTWQALPGNYAYAQMASYHGTMYVLRLDNPANPDMHTHLLASSAGTPTWRELGQQAFGDPSFAVNAFWLNPANGAMLAYVRADVTRLFWLSPYAGSSWHQISPPDNVLVGDVGTVAVQWPEGNAPWHICLAGQQAGAPLDQHNALACTTDGGRTWIDRPALDITLTCSCLKGNSFTSISALNLVGIAPDGALVAIVLDRDDGEYHHRGLYRLAQTSMQWELIGDVPADGNVFMLPGGVMWLVDGPQLNVASLWAGAQYVYTCIYP